MIDTNLEVRHNSFWMVVFVCSLRGLIKKEKFLHKLYAPVQLAIIARQCSSHRKSKTVGTATTILVTDPANRALLD